MLQIRKTTIDDITEVMQIYADGRAIMCESGNKKQWTGNYPPQSMIEEDIKMGLSYVCESINESNFLAKNEILAVFFFSTEPDPTYTKIDGAWLNEEKYGVIHRIARKKAATPLCGGFDRGAAPPLRDGNCESNFLANKKNAKGVGAFCLNWCFEQIKNIRIDTHEANIPMRKLLQNLGFSYCGTIWLENGEERMAFHGQRDCVLSPQ